MVIKAKSKKEIERAIKNDGVNILVFEKELDKINDKEKSTLQEIGKVVRVLKIDAYKFPELRSVYDVGSVRTLHIYKNGKRFHIIEGEITTFTLFELIHILNREEVK